MCVCVQSDLVLPLSPPGFLSFLAVSISLMTLAYMYGERMPHPFGDCSVDNQSAAMRMDDVGNILRILILLSEHGAWNPKGLPAHVLWQIATGMYANVQPLHVGPNYYIGSPQLFVYMYFNYCLY